MDNFEHQVRERAYHIWVRSGMMDGRDREHWLAAESEISRPAQPKSAAAKKPAGSKDARSRRTKGRK